MSNARLLAAMGNADAGFRNKVYNGAFDVWQRGTSGNGAYNTFHNYYQADRWQMFRAGSAAGGTFSRVAYNGPNAIYAARMQRNSGDTSTATMNIAQSLETLDVQYLKGKTVTVSFRYLTGANFSGPHLSFYTSFGTGSDGNIGNGFTNGAGVPGGGKACVPSTVQRYESVTFVVPSNASQFGIGFGYAPSGTAGANDFAEITNVQLEIGSIATPFSYRPQQIELMLCQRFYQRGGGEYNFVFGRWRNYSANADSLLVPVWFKTPMRANPSCYVDYDIQDGATQSVAMNGESCKEGFTHIFAGIAAGQHLDLKGYHANAEI